MPGPFRKDSTKVDDDETVSPNRLIANMRRPQLRQSGSSSNLNFAPLRPSPLTSRPYSGVFDDDNDLVAHVPVPLDPQRGLAAPRPGSSARARSPRIAQLDFAEATRLARAVTPPSSATTMGGLGSKSQENESRGPTRNSSFSTSAESSSSEASPQYPAPIPLPSIPTPPPPKYEHEQTTTLNRMGLEPNRRHRTMSSWDASGPAIFPHKKGSVDEFKFPPSKPLSRPSSFGDLKKQTSGFLPKSSSQTSLSLSTIPQGNERVGRVEKEYEKDGKRGRGKRFSQIVLNVFRPKSKRSKSLAVEGTHRTSVYGT